jgi:hypothetical protein
MDTIQELKQRASALEAKGDDNGALKVYSAIPSDKLEPGLLGRMAAVQVRVGKREDARRSHQRAAAMLLNEGLNNAAIYAFRQLLQVDPGHRESLLRLGQLTGEAGYGIDSVSAFSSYLEAGGGEQLDRLLDALESIPPENRAAIAAELREQILARDQGAAERLDRLMESGGGAGSAVGDAGTGLAAPTADDPVEEMEVAPLEGLETHGSEGVDLPPILGDLPLLDPLGEARDEDDEESATAVAPLHGMIPSLDDLDPLNSGDRDAGSGASLDRPVGNRRPRTMTPPPATISR